ncbi:MAG: hypothetical protein WKG07_27705 [Hymenobacter sp.]
MNPPLYFSLGLAAAAGRSPGAAAARAPGRGGLVWPPAAAGCGRVAPGARVRHVSEKKKDYNFALVELVNSQRRPYPNADWNRWDSLQAPNRFVNVQAAVVDATDMLWVLDPSNPDDEAPLIAGIKLVKINLATNKVERIYRFEDLPRERTGLNDVRVDPGRQVAYLSEPAGGRRGARPENRQEPLGAARPQIGDDGAGLRAAHRRQGSEGQARANRSAAA